MTPTCTTCRWIVHLRHEDGTTAGHKCRLYGGRIEPVHGPLTASCHHDRGEAPMHTIRFVRLGG